MEGRGWINLLWLGDWCRGGRIGEGRGWIQLIRIHVSPNILTWELLDTNQSKAIQQTWTSLFP